MWKCERELEVWYVFRIILLHTSIMQGKKMKLETLNIFEASTTRPKTNISASSRMTYTDECSTVTLPIEPPS
jgi:hypothetical protein